MSEARPNPGSSGSDGAKTHVEVKARTIDEAIARGLVRLGGLSRSEVEITVVKEGKAGVLGFGAEEALVRLTPLGPGETSSAASSAAKAEPASGRGGDAGETDGGPRKRRRRRRRGGGDETREQQRAAEPSQPAQAAAPAPAPAREPDAPTRREDRPARERVAARTPQPAAPREQAPREQAPRSTAPAPKPAADDAAVLEIASEVVGDMLAKLGFEDVRLQPEGGLLPDEMQEDSSAVLCIRGTGTDRLLGRDGESLRALQFITRLMVSRRTEQWTNLLIDVDGDRRRQVKELIALSQQSADLVESDGRPVSLPPMGAYERRVVHIALKDHPTIATQSIGSGDRRKVTVRRRVQLLPEL